MDSKHGFEAVKEVNQQPPTTDHKPIGREFDSLWAHYFLFTD